MAKQRYINTKFWSDNWVSELNPLERYLFLYFLTNEHTNIAGLYELPLRTMAFETGIDKEMLVKMLPRFEGKVYYIEGWIFLKNFAKHQAVNDSVKKGITASMKEIPAEIRAKADSLGTASPQDPTYLNLNSNLNLDLNSKREVQEAPPHTPTPGEVAKIFFSGDTKVMTELFVRDGNREFVEKEVKKFCLYWTEPNKSGTKVKWQQQPTFDVKRRLYTWLSRSKEFSNKFTSGDKYIAGKV